jgi:hypothetical protein
MVAADAVEDLFPFFDPPLDQQFNGTIRLGAFKGAHSPFGPTFHFTLPEK